MDVKKRQLPETCSVHMCMCIHSYYIKIQEYNYSLPNFMATPHLESGSLTRFVNEHWQHWRPFFILFSCPNYLHGLGKLLETSDHGWGSKRPEVHVPLSHSPHPCPGYSMAKRRRLCVPEHCFPWSLGSSSPPSISSSMIQHRRTHFKGPVLLSGARHIEVWSIWSFTGRLFSGPLFQQWWLMSLWKSVLVWVSYCCRIKWPQT